MNSLRVTAPDRLSVSQFSEDILVWDYFGRKRHGIFVEVGANHPKDLSQTWLLEQNGWEGILIEPQSACCERLRQERKSSKVFQVACGSPEQKGAAPFFISTESIFSSLQRRVNDAGLRYIGSETVEVLPLDDVLAEAGNPKIDFVSIDVEGTELDVLRGFSLVKHRPGLLIVEDHLHSLRVHSYISKRGYKLVKRTGCNSWYIPRGHSFHGSLWERLKLYQKVWLGTPFRRLRLKMKKKKEGPIS